jgi:glyoxylase-like metal-dependent hydrolase (beta-lactamase superfamily II)
VTGEPIVGLVQTDYDQERVVGAFFLNVPTIAHDAIWDRMKSYASDKVLSQINSLVRRDDKRVKWRVRMPDVTFSERLILHKGLREVHVLQGGGHSLATCMVHLPAENLVFTGDLVFNNVHPSMSQAESKQWLSSLTALRKMAVDVIVPGHGPICGKEATYPLSDYIREMRAMVRRSFQAGRSKSETSSAVIPEFMEGFPYREADRDRVRGYVKGGSDRIYDEYRAEAKANMANQSSASRRSRVGRQRKRA